MDESQNPVIQGANNIFDSIIGTVGKAVGVYSSFKDADAARKLQALNSQYYQTIPTADMQLASAQTQQNVSTWLLYGGLAIAMIAAGGLIWKAIK
jgi:hypothetical protein